MEFALAYTSLGNNDKIIYILSNLKSTKTIKLYIFRWLEKLSLKLKYVIYIYIYIYILFLQAGSEHKILMVGSSGIVDFIWGDELKMIQDKLNVGKVLMVDGRVT